MIEIQNQLHDHGLIARQALKWEGNDTISWKRLGVPIQGKCGDSGGSLRDNGNAYQFPCVAAVSQIIMIKFYH